MHLSKATKIPLIIVLLSFLVVQMVYASEEEYLSEENYILQGALRSNTYQPNRDPLALVYTRDDSGITEWFDRNDATGKLAFSITTSFWYDFGVTKHVGVFKLNAQGAREVAFYDKEGELLHQQQIDARDTDYHPLNLQGVRYFRFSGGYTTVFELYVSGKGEEASSDPAISGELHLTRGVNEPRERLLVQNYGKEGRYVWDSILPYGYSLGV